jgi:hypothetical protein
MMKMNQISVPEANSRGADTGAAFGDGNGCERERRRALLHEAARLRGLHAAICGEGFV